MEIKIIRNWNQQINHLCKLLVVLTDWSIIGLMSDDGCNALQDWSNALCNAFALLCLRSCSRLTRAGQCGYPFILAKIRSPGFQSRAMLQVQSGWRNQDKRQNRFLHKRHDHGASAQPREQTCVHPGSAPPPNQPPPHSTLHSNLIVIFRTTQLVLHDTHTDTQTNLTDTQHTLSHTASTRCTQQTHTCYAACRCFREKTKPKQPPPLTSGECIRVGDTWPSLVIL